MKSAAGKESEYRFSNHDKRIAFYSLLLENSLDAIEEIPLPAGYVYVNYRPGDKTEWIDIEKSAEEFETYADGEQAWKKYFEGKDDELIHRMFFIENAEGKKIATASAYYNIYKGDDNVSGWLHWVAVRKEGQGQGLSKPLITHVLRYMKTLGYQRAVIPTQTTTWVACKIYLDLGFRPIPENAVNSRTGWKIMRRLTDHPLLSEFEPASDSELFGLPADQQQLPMNEGE